MSSNDKLLVLSLSYTWQILKDFNIQFHLSSIDKFFHLLVRWSTPTCQHVLEVIPRLFLRANNMTYTKPHELGTLNSKENHMYEMSHSSVDCSSLFAWMALVEVSQPSWITACMTKLIPYNASGTALNNATTPTIVTFVFDTIRHK